MIMIVMIGWKNNDDNGDDDDCGDFVDDDNLDDLNENKFVRLCFVAVDEMDVDVEFDDDSDERKYRYLNNNIVNNNIDCFIIDFIVIVDDNNGIVCCFDDNLLVDGVGDEQNNFSFNNGNVVTTDDDDCFIKDDLDVDDIDGIDVFWLTNIFLFIGFILQSFHWYSIDDDDGQISSSSFKR